MNNKNRNTVLSLPEQWKKFKKSGSYSRRLKKNFELFQNAGKSTDVKEKQGAVVVVSKNDQVTDLEKDTFDENVSHNLQLELESEADDGPLSCSSGWKIQNIIDREPTTTDKIRKWATSFNISQRAFKSLFEIVNFEMPGLLPRTLLRTPANVITHQIGKGRYWHQGLQFCLRNYFFDLNKNMKVSINENMDGLPIFRSSKEEVWPILFNIHELPEFKPMVIGIYAGIGKPCDLNLFLRPFVDETKDLLLNGIAINGYLLQLEIRAFICDSPARAFIKGK